MPARTHRLFYFLLLSYFAVSTSGLAQNMLPVITGLEVVADTVSKQITVSFELQDLDSDTLELTAVVSNDGGQTYLFPADFTGDVGLITNFDNPKRLQWNYPETVADISAIRVKLVADDLYKIDIQELVDQVSADSLRYYLETIDGPRNFQTHFTQLQSAKAFISQHFEKIGTQSSKQRFPFSNYVGENIIGRLPGTLDETATYIVNGHYDTVPDSPGADDNGSGTVGMLEAARVLSVYNFKKNIKFVGFDLEEYGLLGASQFVNSGGIDGFERIEGVLNLEMIGYYDATPNSQIFPQGFELLFPEAITRFDSLNRAGIFVLNTGNENSASLVAKYNSCAREYVSELEVIDIVTPGNGEIAPDLRRSDHAPFWDAGIAALMLTDGSEFRNANYHTPNDTIGSLNFEFMQNIVKATVATIATQAEIQHSTVVESEVEITVSTNTTAPNSSKQQLLISPNPGTGLFIVQLTNPLQTSSQLEVLDVSGKIVARQVLAESEQEFQLNLSTLASGTYFVRLITGEMNTHALTNTLVKKIILAK